MNFYTLEELRKINMDSFIQKASMHYGMSTDSMKALLEDYELDPVEASGPSGDEAVPMLMYEIAKKVDLPVEVVARLQDMDLIGNPITYDGVEFLKNFHKTWEDKFLIRSQLASFSQAQRKVLIKITELSEKWERWVYLKYLESDIKYDFSGRMMNPEDRILIKDVAELVEDIFCIPNCNNTLKRIEKIREIAYNDKRKINYRVPVSSVLKKRGLPETLFELSTEVFVFDMYS